MLGCQLGLKSRGRLLYRRRVMREPIRCPRCRRPVVWEGNPHRPFCSERCRLVDLGNWVTERYRIEGEDVEPEDDGGGSSDERSG
jgi:endogenous inhibitor of DNA gyrase (YacG/DUF329 family)